MDDVICHKGKCRAADLGPVEKLRRISHGSFDEEIEAELLKEALG